MLLLESTGRRRLKAYLVGGEQELRVLMGPVAPRVGRIPRAAFMEI